MTDTPIRTSLNRSPSEPATWDQLEPMRRRAWLDRGVLTVRLDELADDFERQFATNIGNRLLGRRGP